MVSYQRPIGSGFGANTTTAQVLEGLDLTGTTAIVTGGYSGIGLPTVRALAGAGATVVVPARRPQAAAGELGGVPGVEIAQLDLADLASVRTFAESFLADGRSLDLLVNNAGVMASPLTRVGPGWEAQFATNHLGHFALTALLWPALVRAGGARVISLSSVGHKASDIRWDDLQFHNSYDKWQAYGQAKTANVLFARHLDRLGEPAGVRAFSVFPGGIHTPLQRYLPKAEMVALGWIDEEGNDIYPWKSPDQGAATTVWAATSPRLEGMGGVYCEDVDVAVIADLATEEGHNRGVNPYAIDPESAQRLWVLSAGLTGTDIAG
ncbi:SDR family NAD(P)-dependent oxidoreductase [Kineosporia succinea]|uniref:NAD(P)-dependent dehydrogenase (Short-subunit alcohol dehydrogenase family) n=1 Tax=Kineosporia succinea TaxID=84632 RepID=A0ABT9PCE5_9ACTN|nr:SDR family NAD(P)-dependent oxidoreductase [Kineosporia succinea]MDP9830358.1 NAD(P)-dependent dehydrogenase (short-subunit alcohol dehydrogenase family) [Kineosporia succinea]